MSELLRRLYDNAYLLMTMVALFWAMNFVAGRAAAGEVPPVALAFLRWAGASMILIAISWRPLVRDWREIRANLPVLLLLGFTGTALFNTFQYIALTYTTALSAAVINSSGPVLIAIAGYLLFADTLRWGQIAGIAISSTGVLAIVAQGDPAALAGFKAGIGELIMLAAMVLMAVYTVNLRNRPRIHPLSFATAISVIAAAVNLPPFLAEWALGAQIHWSPLSVLQIAYVTIFPSVISYLFFNRGVELIGPTRAGAFIHLVPLFAALLSIALLGEEPRPYHAVGFLLILAGVGLVVRKG